MERRNKKPKVEEPLLLPPNVQVKQEVDVVVAAEGDTSKEMDIKFDSTLLRCPVCSDRLRPPVFQCTVAFHIACSSCQGKLPRKRCHSCDHGGGVYVRSPPMDKIVCSARVQCAHHQHGCPCYIAYFEAPDHERACPRAPCSCTVPGCGIVASPANLLGHLASAHAWPVHNISYRTHLGLTVRALLVAAEEDGAVFLLSVGPLGPARAVSVVCVRANGDAGQQYSLKLWAHGSGDRSVMLDSEVRTSAAPGDIDMEAAEYLAVPPAMMSGSQSGREMALTVCINEASVSNIHAGLVKERPKRTRQPSRTQLQ